MLALPKVVADFSAAGAFFAKRVAQSSLPLPSPCKCSAYLPCATCWVCTVSVPPFDDVSHFAGSMLPVSKSSQTSPGQAEAPPPPVAVPPAPASPPLPPLPVLPEGVDALGEQAANNSDTPHANARDRTVRTSPIAITRPSTWAGAGYLLKNRTKA